MSAQGHAKRGACQHAEVLPIPGNEDWGRCTACGADDFPLTAKAAYGDVECSACNDTGLVPVDLTGQSITHRDGTTSIAGPGHFADAACPACGEGCRVEPRVPALPLSPEKKAQALEVLERLRARPGLLLRADASGRVNVQVQSESLTIQSRERLAVRLRLACRFVLTGRMNLANAVSTFPDCKPEGR